MDLEVRRRLLLPTPKLRKGPDAVLITCRIFSVVTAVFAIFCIVVNVFSAIRSFEDGADVFDGIFRCYAVVIACFVVLAETEWNFIIKFWKVLEYWVGRGMLQILYVFVICCSDDKIIPNYNSEKQELVFLQNLASYLLGCGRVYVISILSAFKKDYQQDELRIARDLYLDERKYQPCYDASGYVLNLKNVLDSLIEYERNQIECPFGGAALYGEDEDYTKTKDESGLTSKYQGSDIIEELSVHNDGAIFNNREERLHRSQGYINYHIQSHEHDLKVVEIEDYMITSDFASLMGALFREIRGL